MKTRELRNLGIAGKEALQKAYQCLNELSQAGLDKRVVRQKMKRVASQPELYLDDPVLGKLASCLTQPGGRSQPFQARTEPAPYNRWGGDVEDAAVQQMENACQLPIAVAGALMPDAHVGYGLPIGGVLATRNAVIPYAVGVDIACRMKMSVLDIPPDALKSERESDSLATAIHKETRFGIGAKFRQRRRHQVMDEDWTVTQLTRQLKDKAWAQLGTSGSGNHFVEFGILTLDRPELGLEPGEYLALLSHSGSRGTGATIASHYSRLAMEQHPELPKHLRHLAWLELDSQEGQEYWQAMELMGKYAAANHSVIHQSVRAHLGAELLLDLENHHNFAWKERHLGQDVIVHRKGATPAGSNELGIIPGTMGTPGYIVRGKGLAESLHSSAHGAGRRMSRKAAHQKFQWSQVKEFLAASGVTLLSAGLDEAPMAYKDIQSVMAAQSDLVEPVARFDPKLVKMAPAGERPED